MSRRITVAAIQINSKPLCTKENLAHAEVFVEQASAQGAELVLLPELMPGGYFLTEEIWSIAEPVTGPTVAWLNQTASRFGIFLGMSYAEVDGADFFNSFVLSNPQGTLAGRVRKSPPASHEAYFFRAGDDPHFIDTDIGRIGVGICYENLLHDRVCALHQASVDIVVQPTAGPTPVSMRLKDAAALEGLLKDSPASSAQALGVPVIMANHCGRGPLLRIFPRRRFPAMNSTFPGLSSVTDSDGELLVQLGAEEGIALATVALDPARKVKQSPQAHGRWSLPVPWYAFVWPITQKLGERAYARHPARAQRALAIADTPSKPRTPRPL
jgi:N-carbamoylputrescine amidase